MSTKHLHKSSVYCVFAAAHKNEFTENSQMSANATWKLAATETHRAFPLSTQIHLMSSSICAHWILAWAKSTCKSSKKWPRSHVTLLRETRRQQFDFFPGKGNELPPGTAQLAPEPSQDTRGNWSCNTYIDRGFLTFFFFFPGEK